jgi:hypothetical protein
MCQFGGGGGLSAAPQGGGTADIDPHDDDLFVDGEARRRARLLAIGTFKPEPHDQSLPRFIGSNPPRLAPVRTQSAAAPDAAPRRPTPAWLFALLGFVVGIGFWHAVGFWGFISQIVLPAQKPVQTATSTETPATTVQVNAPAYQPARPTRQRP